MICIYIHENNTHKYEYPKEWDLEVIEPVEPHYNDLGVIYIFLMLIYVHLILNVFVHESAASVY